MLNQHRLQPGRMDRASAAATPQQPAMNVDAERAPVTFGWWLYSQERFVGHYHLETLYRLDRGGARLGDHSSVGTLQPSEYYGQSTEALRELVRVRQHILLPRVPAGYRWLGPQLVHEVPCALVEVPTGTGKLQDCSYEVPADPKARLDFARSLASKILCDRVTA